MIVTHKITSFDQYLREVLPLCKKEKTYLFRGQPDNDPLLPKIARPNPRQNTVEIEREMLSELRRIGGLILPNNALGDWDLLVLAQHFGMATRLLDWTTNPLVALWFSCTYANPSRSSFVYVLRANQEYLLNSNSENVIFKHSKTKVVRPNLNNPRIVAQSGWFTAHCYSKSSSRFVPLDENKEFKGNIRCLKVPSRLRDRFIQSLKIMDVSFQSMFPDLEGVCRHLNTLYGVG